MALAGTVSDGLKPSPQSSFEHGGGDAKHLHLYIHEGSMRIYAHI